MRKKTKQIALVIILVTFVLYGFRIPSNEKKFSTRLLNEIRQLESHQPITVWVYFTDKGKNIKEKLALTKVKLSDRCFQRRLRHGIKSNLVDLFDVPVKQSYVESIKKMVKRIRHQSRWLNAVSAEATPQQLKKIASLPIVRKIDKVQKYLRPPEPKSEIPTDYPFMPQGKKIHKLDYGDSYGQVSQINVPRLHDMGFSGKGVLICMLDAGFNNLSHEALDHLDIVDTWDFVNNDAEVFDEIGDMGEGSHGTNTLGTIAGFQQGELIGPAYNASFILGKTENTEWERHVEEDHWVAGAEWAENKGANIISSSLGYRDQFTHGETDYDWTDIDGETTVVSSGARIATQKGVLIVNSAGNEYDSSPPYNTIVSPSDCESVLAAGAVDLFGDRVDFSSMGPTADGRIKPDVMAMGRWVYTSDLTENNYGFVNGTSFSCPLIAGAAALILEAHPDWTNWQIMDALKNTASQSDSPDFSHGWGIINAHQAILYQQNEVYPPLDFSFHRLGNDFIFFFEYIDQISWKVNTRNTKKIKYYRLYRKSINGKSQNFELVVQLESDVMSHNIRGLKKNEIFLYKITAVDGSGQESDPNYTLGWKILN